MNESSEEPFNNQLWSKLTEQWKNFHPSLVESQPWNNEFNDFYSEFKVF